MGIMAATTLILAAIGAERHALEQRTQDALNALVAMGETLVQAPAPRLMPTSNPAEAVHSSRVARDSGPTLPLVARRLAELTRGFLGSRGVSLVAVDATTGRLHPVVVAGLPSAQEQAWWANWPPPPCLEECLNSTSAAALCAGEPVMLDVRRLSEHAHDHLTQARTIGWTTGRVIPMRMGAELVGLLVVNYADHGHHPVSQQERVLTGTIARLGALVLERDRWLHRWAEAQASVLALRETKAQMDTFLGIAGHELKTPLTSLKLDLQLTERRLRAVAHRLAPSLAPARAGEQAPLEGCLAQLAMTMQPLQRLERLVNDLTDVSRIEAGSLELRLEEANLLAIVQQAIAAQRHVGQQRPIRFNGPAEESVPVLADPWRIEQVVTNYLTNALKYSPPDGFVEVGVQTVSPNARVWVRDQGPGLPAEEQERVWERFHRVKGIEVQSGSGVGLGLGLHICRTIIEQHEGQVGVASAPGQGSTFWFTLPLIRQGEAVSTLTQSKPVLLD
jgi:signal transduction histidine kinase